MPTKEKTYDDSQVSQVKNEDIENFIKEIDYRVFNTTTCCFLTLKNGFMVLGTSACVDSANFNEELGQDYARDDAISKCWEFLGFALACSLTKEFPTFSEIEQTDEEKTNV